MRTLALLAAALVALALTGCATVTRGSSETFVVTTEPAGARVTLSSGETCVTPCALEKRRKHAFDVEIEHDGYAPVFTQIIPQVSGAGATGMAGNVLVGGIIGIGVDAATGATRDLRPNPLEVKLVALPVPDQSDAGVTGSLEDDSESTEDGPEDGLDPGLDVDGIDPEA